MKQNEIDNILSHVLCDVDMFSSEAIFRLNLYIQTMFQFDLLLVVNKLFE